MVSLPRYNSPATQVVLVSLVCFATVGMFSAIGNLGAGGTQNIVLSDITNAVLYALFAVTGFVSGSVNNVLGPRLTLFVGSIGYVIYVSALWVYQVHQVQWYLILSGAILGMCAACLWSAQGAIMMSYPSEKEKGRMFSIFWVIFNSGSLMGGLIALGIDLAQGAISATATSTYIAFLVVMLCGVCLTWALLPPGRVVRADQTLVKLHSYNNPKNELKGMWAAIRTPSIILLLPMFFASNYFYTYQSAFAFALFDAQTRALNGVVKSTGQIIGAIAIGTLYDKAPFKKRRNRGLVGITLTGIFLIIAYSWGLRYQLQFNRSTKITRFNFKDAGFGEPIAILALYDVGDAMYQGTAYWIMGALSNDPFTLARYAGLYKAIQSAGSAAAFGIDAVKTEFLNELLSAWSMLLFSLIPATFVVWRIRDSNTEIEEVAHIGDKLAAAEGETAPLEDDGFDEKDESKSSGGVSPTVRLESASRV